MSKSKSTRAVERSWPPRPPAEPTPHEAPRMAPHPPAKRRGPLIASLVLLSAWLLFLLGLAIFGS
jgi:hypothetical protein